MNANPLNFGPYLPPLYNGKLAYVNTADSTTISNPGAGTETAFSLTFAVPAHHFCLAGKTVRISSDFLCGGSGLNTTNMRLTAGGTVAGGGIELATTGATQATGSATQWRFITYLVCRSTGATGTLASATVSAVKIGSTAIQVLQTVATVDLTATVTLGYTITFSTTNAGNTGIQRLLMVEYLN